MAVRLEIEDRGAGRWIAATKDVAPGTLLLTSTPFATVLSPSLWTERCQACFEPGSLARCAAASFMLGSKQCQLSDWRLQHKLECPRLERLVVTANAYSVVADALLVARTLRLVSAFPAQNEARSLDDRSTHPWNLVWSEADRAAVHSTAAIVDHTGLLPSSMSYTLSDIEEMLCRFHTNNFTITDEILLDIGSGCYPWAAMVNHSCDANCTVTFAPKSHELQMRALRPIAAGEEITHAYMDVAIPATKRRRQLQAQYHFDCSCARCTSPTSFDLVSDAGTDGGPIDSGASPDLARATQLVAAAVPMSPQEAITCLREALVLRSAHLHALNVDVLEVHSHLLTQYLAARDFENARGAARAMWTFYEAMYPTTHAMAGLHLYTLGDLEAQWPERLGESRAHLQEAHRILAITHGREHPLVHGLRSVLASMP
ncbi:hypothetical protein SPRG_03109 [Saprolegnia parasitica CBS 223.65]|uniref:SET domain-containing protein n=1 Tax=Saprolegnia parasitica (strain CBS 223.65) TaxID=695850 RepID=A0A067CN07_SAPPC|nr:hypothetical protein SPRG_03109 [Saprolegnia parasitica CBS 223.65]KDO31893.1 hypothetical protein SPRG_03109 [Saprolegnia parasitica CBS 223.65]|eukprot:XP_012197092.1 hypothetical protein SPRG_03109 [Saprolegnia parasitica CBS 223.65]